MVNQIKQCQKCNLCKNQKPLLDVARKCQIVWVGLSAKKTNIDEDIPLSPNTNTGMLISRIEELCDGVTTYKTNLVKCLPLTKEDKLRYPSKKEIDCCFDNLLSEIDVLEPRIVFLLGEKVYSAVGRHLNIQFEKWDEFEYLYKRYNETYYIPIHHPSYICVYKRKYMQEYINGIEKIINKLLYKHI